MASPILLSFAREVRHEKGALVSEAEFFFVSWRGSMRLTVCADQGSQRILCSSQARNIEEVLFFPEVLRARINLCC